MRTVVVGAGPVGLFCAMSLARRGHEVVVVERDAPPSEDGAWERRSVMQFNLPHFFRHYVRLGLLEMLPDVWERLIAAGGLPARGEGHPEELTGLQCRRSTFERAFWAAAAAEPSLSIVHGHADSIVCRGERVDGVTVDGAVFPADLVIVAAGRVGRLWSEHRAPGEGGICGYSYAGRMYRAKDGVDIPTTGLPIPAVYDGYQAIVFPQDDRTLSALFVRPTSDIRLNQIRNESFFQAAAARVPNMAEWTDLDRFDPITPVMAGSGFSNFYVGQLDADGKPGPAGLFFVGDAVCTTNPASGRGISLGYLQASQLLRLIDEGSCDLRDAAVAFDDWCTEYIRPWFEDHVRWDASTLARFRGEDIDVESRLPSNVICAAASVDPSMMSVVGPFMGMLINPNELQKVEDKARAVLRTGWRPPYAKGPSAADLADLFAVAPSSLP